MSSELGRRIAVTLCALLVYRLGTYIPIPGIDLVEWQQIFHRSGGILGTVNAVSGGAVQRLSIFAIGIMPFVSAAILIQLLTMVGAPALGQFRKAGESGRRMASQYTLGLTLLLVIVQSYGISVGLEGFTGLVSEPGLLFRLSTVASLTGGTIFLIWLCQFITVRGVGNGLALLLFSGIVTQLPASIAGALEAGREGVTESNLLLLLAVAMVVLVGLIVAMELARRRVPVEFAGRQVGMHARTSNLSLKLNSAGVIPTMVASWFVYIAILVVEFAGHFDDAWVVTVRRNFGPQTAGHMIATTIAIVLFAFIYTAFVVDPEQAAEKLKAYGGVIPGIEPGEATAAYLDQVVSRTTILGATYVAVIALIPELVIAYANVPFYFGGVSALVVVCVTLDISAQVRGDGLVNTGGEHK